MFFFFFLHDKKGGKGRMGLSLMLVTVFLIFSFGSSSFFTHMWTVLLLLLSLIACNWSIFFVFQFFILENCLKVFGSLIRRETQLKEVSSHFVLCSVLQVRQLHCRFVDYPLGIPRFFHLASFCYISLTKTLIHGSWLNRSNRGHKFRFMGNGYQLTRGLRAFSLSLKVVIEVFDIILLIIYSALKWVGTIFCYFEEMNARYCFPHMF